ncbi:MAG TPA: hypothetical protein VGY54_24700, partial [Polyangiaceae bacterium]|nr:hypothetical protein [Polyangiaceae bacterium]
MTIKIARRLADSLAPKEKRTKLRRGSLDDRFLKEDVDSVCSHLSRADRALLGHNDLNEEDVGR